jgi:hypothetical protein
MEPHPGQLYKKIISFDKYSLIQGGFPIAPLNPFGHNVGFPIFRGCCPFSAEKEPLALSPGATNPP